MLEQNDSIAVAALLVALVALLNTILQVLQQYFATADGYRRCSSSVMGEWAHFTQRKFKFRELRFETVFASPFISMEVAYDVQELQKLPEAGAIAVLDGSEEMSSWPGLRAPAATYRSKNETKHNILPLTTSFANMAADPHDHEKSVRPMRRRKIGRASARTQHQRSKSWRTEEFLRMDRDPASDITENEPVSWIPLLQALQAYSSSLHACGLVTLQDISTGSLRHGRVLAPTLRLTKKSWDFMPAEVLKPYAMSTVRDIAIIGQLLGLHWTIFNPEEGLLRAEGDGCIITSFQIRPMGTMATFFKTDKRIEHRRKMHGVVLSPLEGAIALGFGVIHSDVVKDYLGRHDAPKNYQIYSKEDCRDTLMALCNGAGRYFDEISRQILETIMTDVLGILTPVLRLSGTSITYIVKPSEYINSDVVSTRGCFLEFCSELANRHMKFRTGLAAYRFATLNWIHSVTSRLAENTGWDEDFGRPRLTFASYARVAILELLKDLHDAWNTVTAFLVRHWPLVRLVMSSHFSAMLELHRHIDSLQPNHPSRYLENSRTARTKMMRFYFDVCCKRCVDEVCPALEERERERERSLPTSEPTMSFSSAFAAASPRETVEEIWVALMFRSVCWHALHNIDEKVVAVPPRYYDSHLPVYIS